MADIAVIFHWSLESMAAMDLLELAQWRERARLRSGADE
ncbi:GpE family phage tail protein [Dechloromonas denitrificans]|nr:GpE family phage tail protein [Dechloromonas denitrificans]UCV02312.1 GpE family phage tail protein [Dechloromonas denitrificans]